MSSNTEKLKSILMSKLRQIKVTKDNAKKQKLIREVRNIQKLLKTSDNQKNNDTPKKKLRRKVKQLRNEKDENKKKQIKSEAKDISNKIKNKNKITKKIVNDTIKENNIKLSNHNWINATKIMRALNKGADNFGIKKGTKQYKQTKQIQNILDNGHVEKNKSTEEIKTDQVTTLKEKNKILKRNNRVMKDMSFLDDVFEND